MPHSVVMAYLCSYTTWEYVSTNSKLQCCPLTGMHGYENAFVVL